MLFLGKDEPGLAIRFRDKNNGTVRSLAFVVPVELCKDRAMSTRGRGSTSSALAALLCRRLCDMWNMYVQEPPAVGAVVDHIELLEVSEFAISEPLSILVVRVELEGREEQEVDPWPGSEAPEV